MFRTTTRLIASISLVAAAGCSNEAKPEGASNTLAPAATSLSPSKAPTADARKLVVDKAASHADFVMDAPEEKMVGHVPGTTSGEFQVDLMDVTKSTGLVSVDLSALEILQAKVDASGKLGPEKKVEAQNGHARVWLEIGPDAPDDKRKENSLVKFSIKSIETTGEKNVTKLTGAERKLALKVTGDFLLHGHKAEKVAELEATFKFDGPKLVGATFKSVKPFGVNLAEHDVKPRDAFGKLALKTLETLAPKVAKEAMVVLEVSASAAP